DAVYGLPKVGGIVHVRNYDADIQDRLAVGGGYYIPNGPDGPEIRFPVYNSDVSAEINYVHTLLLAYASDAPYPFDALSEGLVRAATMRVVRSPNILPGSPDPAVIEATLDSLYDVSTFYDWYNQPALGAKNFIAPNLLDTTLPAGGSTGGIYLARYQMAGTAWSKVLTQYPGFAKEFNTRYYASPSAFVTMDDFANLGQQVIDFLTSTANSQIEGLSFFDWVKRQYILDTSVTAGLKVMVQPFPIQAVGGTSDFGVFAIDVNTFRTSANGDEALLAGTAFPVYWMPDFTRFFASVQDDSIKIAGAFGSVVPNFTSVPFGGQQYRVAVDVPFAGGDTRVVLPAGSVSTGTNPTFNNFYGTLTGLPIPATGVSYRVSIDWLGGSLGPIPVDNFAFGANITDASYLNAQLVTVHVFQVTIAGPSELFSRQVVKGVGPLALNVSTPDSYTTFNGALLARLALTGLPLQPFRIRPNEVLGISEDQTLFARWNPVTVRYDLFPDAGQVLSGLGFYARPSTGVTLAVDGYSAPFTPVAVSLQPGWNIVTVPFSQTLGTNNLSFTVASQAMSTYDQAVGSVIDPTIFEFNPDPSNPDLGTLVPATSLAPGKGYFVRALQPDGAVMLFTPTDFAAAARRFGPTRFSVGAPRIGLGRPIGGTTGLKVAHWESEVKVTNSNYVTSYVQIGQSANATKGYDPKFDSQLPPSPGGFQVSIDAGVPLYRDINVWGDVESFKIVVSGLTSGERFRVEIAQIYGNKRLTLIDSAGNRYSMSQNRRVYFTATGTTQRFEVTTR
ncbi:MAG TPA: hypothetical protein VNI20_11950, partial [Fimbriimonadaceae bacterium]|nr:hypothetical protein [Fimbriimonadaceae bacterium]